MRNQDYVQRDLAVVGHPCTQMNDHESLPEIPIRRGDGVWLEDFEGNRYLDAISSSWVNLFGHSNPYINAAPKEQIDTLEHGILAGLPHAAVVELSEQLVSAIPPGLANGVMLRPLENVVYFMPPYIITEQQVQTMASVAWQAILSAVQD